ncbi:hypothetical protein H8Z79_01725 [Blautia sp. 2744]|uniref:Uncharacterized protein n=1 Tax=Blautia intestinalis TaxID=2763028 RepID=A0ABR7HY66_9FIRM|nr:hypothetical protein [Blautia intestinalis]MBC5739191.1 hypothetical protein [Blautia intestinalis]RHD33698.1 hypothetical protein DW799_03910 [Blautia obeum]
MKKLAKSFLVILMGLFMSVNVMADVQTGKTEPDYSTDYYMIVESKAGGIDFYSQPDFDSTKLNDEQIPNGTALHITGEVEDTENNRTWGYTEYHKMNGYAPMDECRPAQSRKEAIDSELYIAGKDHVNYNADYDVKAYAEEGTQKLYQGPGEKYGEVPGVRDIENGETLHITQDAEMVDGSHWGVTTVDGTEGWMNLEKTEEWLKEHPEAQTEAVDAEPVTEETVDTEAAAENAVSAEPVENSEETTASKATKKSATTTTPKAAATPKVTVTPKVTATPAPTETSAPTATTEPAETPAPTAAAEAAETPTAAATVEPEKEDTEAAQDESDAESRQASGQDVRSTSGHWYQNPFTWIIAVAVLAIAGLLIYHYKKR